MKQNITRSSFLAAIILLSLITIGSSLAYDIKPGIDRNGLICGKVPYEKSMTYADLLSICSGQWNSSPQVSISNGQNSRIGSPPDGKNGVSTKKTWVYAPELGNTCNQVSVYYTYQVGTVVCGSGVSRCNEHYYWNKLRSQNVC